jgi:hypothetical protein
MVAKDYQEISKCQSYDADDGSYSFGGCYCIVQHKPP